MDRPVALAPQVYFQLSNLIVLLDVEVLSRPERVGVTGAGREDQGVAVGKDVRAGIERNDDHIVEHVLLDLIVNDFARRGISALQRLQEHGIQLGVADMIVVGTSRVCSIGHIVAAEAIARVRIGIEAGCVDGHIEVATRHVGTIGVGTEEGTSGEMVRDNVDTDLLQFRLNGEDVVHTALGGCGLNTK